MRTSGNKWPAFGRLSSPLLATLLLLRAAFLSIELDANAQLERPLGWLVCGCSLLQTGAHKAKWAAFAPLCHQKGAHFFPSSSLSNYFPFKFAIPQSLSTKLMSNRCMKRAQNVLGGHEMRVRSIGLRGERKKGRTDCVLEDTQSGEKKRGSRKKCVQVERSKLTISPKGEQLFLKLIPLLSPNGP